MICNSGHFLLQIRYQLPIVFLVMNNSGIYRGVDEETWNDIVEDPALPLRYTVWGSYLKGLTNGTHTHTHMPLHQYSTH